MEISNKTIESFDKMDSCLFKPLGIKLFKYIKLNHGIEFFDVSFVPNPTIKSNEK